MNEELPSDYEPCGQCGFDHAYEPNEAYRWHFGHDKHGSKNDKEAEET